VRVWTLDGEVLIASITAKLHLISPMVMEGLSKALELAESRLPGPGDLVARRRVLGRRQPRIADAGVHEERRQGHRARDQEAAGPDAAHPLRAGAGGAAMRGIALGGGCELAVYSSKRVAAMETYIGLVEVGVGLMPAGGGLAYVARRAAEMANAAQCECRHPEVPTDGFTNAAMAKVGTSAIESRKLGYLLWSDLIVPHKDELLHVACTQAKAMAASGWRAPTQALFPVAGRNAIATIKGQLANMRDGGFISAHDFHISTLIAEVVCGGDVDAGSLVSEEYLMTMERERFCSLLDHPKTQERIMGMLQTGKPVRN
jgi:3-hydroxyacyl-CoA dehydrogenase